MKVARIRPQPPPPALPRGVAGPLLRWYARAGRDLPWRRSPEPYRVWVSEVMLQQTQVERVREFFVRFVTAFPDVRALAAADEDEVLRLWEGLGYYRRARQLHAAARRVVADHGGRLPRTAESLRTLPGIGRYTAGAIASIAFDVPEPIVEANSRRVIARLAGFERPLDTPDAEAAVWRMAAALVPQRNPGRFNQALMDLGALVCTPARPRCTDCPLAKACVAHGTNRVDSIPATSVRRRVERIRETALVVQHGGRVLVERRGPGEWWEGLWDFPRSGSAAKGRLLGRVAYSVTHHRVECVVRGCRSTPRFRTGKNRRWVTPAGLAKLAMTAPGRRIAALLKTVAHLW